MKTFAEYYIDLLKWEKEVPCELISGWDQGLIDEVKQDFGKAATQTKIKGSVFDVRKGSSNQSIGNQVETYTVAEMNEELTTFVIENCEGAGYPDRVLAKGDVRNIALEMKATSKWNDKDSNRTVLTSSSAKLRNRFKPPIYHVLCTSIYTINGWSITVGSLRLDFIEPTSDVNIRLEASMRSQMPRKILSDAPAFADNLV